MAKKRRQQDNDEMDKKKSLGSKLFAILLGILIVVVWLGIVALLIKLDVGNFGSTILRPLIKDVPVISKILPDVSEEEIAYENDYPYKTLKEAIERIKELELINDTLMSDDDGLANRIEELEAEVNRLRVFEENQVAFEERVLEFEKNIVFAEAAPNIEEYRQYYESIDPTNAEEIYRQVIEQIQYSEAIKEKADIYRKMKPAEAAAILETMTADIEAVAKILLSMRPSESSLILAKMDTVAAAKITKKMLDMDEARLGGNSN